MSILSKPVRLIALIGVLAGGLVALLTLSASGQAASTAPSGTSFQLTPNAKFLGCLRGPEGTPSASVRVVRGSLNDQLTITLNDFKPNLRFDMFTVQRSPLLANGMPDPSFKGFGLAWYQSDLQTNSDGDGTATIKTILLDQIFGFDPEVNLPPTNTFHVGFWFNNPADAAPCGFTGTTPFNGSHDAGPLAAISRPNASTQLGPLCTNPDRSTTPVSCKP